MFIKRFSKEIFRRRYINKIFENIYFYSILSRSSARIAHVILISLANFLIINHLGPSLFGRVILNISIIKIANLIFGLGINSSFKVLWFQQKEKIKLIGSALRIQIFTNIMIIPLILFSKLFIDITKQDFNILMIIAICNLFNETSILNIILINQKKGYKLAQIDLLASVLTILFTLFIVNFNLSIYTSALALSSYNLFKISILISSFSINKLILFIRKYNKNLIFKLINTGKVLLFTGFGYFAIHKIDVIMIGIILDNYSVGIYATASKISHSLDFLPLVLNSTYFPLLVNKNLTTKKKKIELKKYYRLSFYIAIFITLTPLLLNFLAIKFFFTSEYAITMNTTSILVLGNFIFTFFVTQISWLQSQNKLKMTTLMWLVTVIINIFLNSIMIKLNGINGAAISSILSLILGLIFICFFERKMFINLKKHFLLIH